ncbi:peptidoglycan-binding protein [Luteolibacter ambystomatis]|uniref:Peptidoglycan-binding protein n=1 Tax=Luteolibacter ambystomatis TaxID=2824561 RepID=A0A975IYU9_9BACT|nr:peptidoglycan-binding domain-containing protein [Luteolibacter ambystomatis]QUE50519.1 peptidoglycan-binding protein [Luteolibacter ambystomatis]
MKHLPTLLLGTVLAVAAAAPADAAPYHHGSYRPPGYRPMPPAPVYPPRPVSPRERKEYRAQLRLRQLGYYHGRVDGSIGPVTQRAIARFQRDHRLRVTAWLDVYTLRALGVL